MYQDNHTASRPATWNKGKLVGQKAPLKLKHIWAIPVRLDSRQFLRLECCFDCGYGLEFGAAGQ